MSGREHPVETLSAYLDGALTADERRDVERHLETCPSCARLLDDLRTISRDLHDEGIPEVPAELRARVRRALDAERGTVVPFRRRFAIPATVAATLGAVALLAIAYRFVPMEAPAPRPALERPAAEPPAKAVAPVPPAARPPAPRVQAPARAAEPAPEPERDSKANRADREEVAEEAGTTAAPAPPPPAAPTPTPVGEEKASAPVAGYAPPAPSRDESHRVYQSRATIRPGPDCRETFEPYDAPLERVAADPVAELAEADRFVGGLHGTIVLWEHAPLERGYEVLVRDWIELRHFLVSSGFETASGDEPVPGGADCIRVRVEISAAPR